MVSIVTEDSVLSLKYPPIRFLQSIVGQQAFVDYASCDPDMRWGERFSQYANCKGWGNGRGVKVAILDSGIDHLHPDLPKALSRIDFSETQLGDQAGGGTIGAGIIAGQGRDRGFRGMAPNVTLVSAKLFDRPGESIPVERMVAAFKWVLWTAPHIVVLPVPIGPALYSHMEDTLMAFFAQGGVLVSGPSRVPHIPDERFHQWIRVGSSVRMQNSNKMDSFSSVDISLDSSAIWSTCRLGSYAQVESPSIAIYQVAGLLASMRSTCLSSGHVVSELRKICSKNLFNTRISAGDTLFTYGSNFTPNQNQKS
jgi:hypothetical protein